MGDEYIRQDLILPALFKTSAMDRILETVPLHFQFPPIRAFANFGADIIKLLSTELLEIVKCDRLTTWRLTTPVTLCGQYFCIFEPQTSQFPFSIYSQIYLPLFSK